MIYTAAEMEFFHCKFVVTKLHNFHNFTRDILRYYQNRPDLKFLKDACQIRSWGMAILRMKYVGQKCLQCFFFFPVIIHTSMIKLSWGKICGNRCNIIWEGYPGSVRKFWWWSCEINRPTQCEKFLLRKLCLQIKFHVLFDQFTYKTFSAIWPAILRDQDKELSKFKSYWHHSAGAAIKKLESCATTHWKRTKPRAFLATLLYSIVTTID